LHDIVNYQSIGALIAFLAVLVWVKSSKGSSRALLVGSLVLICVAVAHVFFSASMETAVAGLKSVSGIGLGEEDLAKSAIARWNLIIPFLVGGLGVNMLNTWATR